MIGAVKREKTGMDGGILYIIEVAGSHRHLSGSLLYDTRRHETKMGFRAIVITHSNGKLVHFDTRTFH